MVQEQPLKLSGLELTLMGVIVVASLMFLHVQVTFVTPQTGYTKVCPARSHYCSTNLFSCAVHLCGECIADDGTCISKVKESIAPWGDFFDLVLVLSAVFGTPFCVFALGEWFWEQVVEWCKQFKRKHE